MTENKTSIRKRLLKKRLQLTKKEVENLSKRILKKLIKRPEFKASRVVLLYHPIKNEVDPIQLLSVKTKILALPRICKNNRLHIHKVTDPQTLTIGRFNIKEPSTKNPTIARKNLDLIITPGLAFDPKGHRIGYGKGYFDKLFKNLSTKCVKIALAYDFQIIENVPADKHDQKVDLIITEKRIISPK
ncbi:MAG: 5-formyltetrahydrofolate cyclo-ligase [Candidatus Gracilibacteria bacterium]